VQFLINVDKCEEIRGSNRVTKEQWHRPMKWQNIVEQDLTAITTLSEIYFNVQKHILIQNLDPIQESVS
jgi:hypothetical protein